MKKTLWMLGVAVAALTSCTQNEVLDVPESKLIAFDSFVDKPTRATNDIVDGNDASNQFKEFYVFGAKGTKNGETFTADSNDPYYLDHVQVKGGKGNWTYSPHQSWVADKTFRFAAYADGYGDGSASAAKLNNVTFITDEVQNENRVWGLDITNYAVSDKDLIVAVPDEKVITSITSTPASVGLTFKHVLAKVIFQFRFNGNSNNLKLEIEPFSFNAAGTGNCKARFTGVEDNTVIGATWDNNTYNESTNKKTYSFFGKVNDQNQTWESGNIQSEVYVIPQSNETIVVPSITINTKKKDDGSETSTMTYSDVPLKIIDHTVWKPGYVYRYVADITPNEHYIHFTTSVTSWRDEDNRNQTIQNGN